jgi:gas vesicle protein
MKTAEKVIGAGLGVAALAAIGAYFLTGKNGEKNRDAIRGWMLRMKGEVLEKVEDLKTLKKEDYYRIVDEAAARYDRLERVSSEELKRLTEDMKGAWEHISKELK